MIGVPSKSARSQPHPLAHRLIRDDAHGILGATAVLLGDVLRAKVAALAGA
jgi:hypothetical protein